MLKLSKTKVIIIGIVILIIAFLTPGFFDYFEYRQAAVEAQGGFPWQCGVTMITMGVPSCVLVQGVCSTCSFCDASACSGYDMIVFTGQEPGCKGATYACIQSGTPIKGGGTSLMTGVGGQAILAGTTNKMMSGNVIVAMPGATARVIDNVVNWFDKYIIAGFKN